MDYDDFGTEYTPTDLCQVDQMEQAFMTLSSKTTMELNTRAELKSYFLNNAVPSSLSMLAISMGVPFRVYDCIEVDFQRKCLHRMNELFNVWYPRAKEIGQKNGLLPVHILVHVKYTHPHFLYSMPVSDTNMKEFVHENGQQISKVIDHIHSVLEKRSSILREHSLN